ncbi:hypothetical protein J6590_074397 [Homalodisca vitripennis]|nr:hypothetical protein J6590_074397 [Homalodisca vitripennis]
MHVTPPEITAPDSLCPPPCLGRHWKFTLYARYTTRDHSSRQSLPSPLSGITAPDSLCPPPVWVGTITLYARYTTRDHSSRQSLLSPCLGRHWNLLSMRYTTRITTSLCPPRAWVGTGHLLSMHVTPPGITAPDSLCSPPCLGRHWTFTLYARYTTRDHNSRQSLLSPLSGQALEIYSLCTLHHQGSQLTTVSAIPRTWVGTGHLLSMDVTPPGITTHDSLCSPPCLGRHWTFTLYARYTTRDHNSRQSLLSPVPG